MAAQADCLSRFCSYVKELRDALALARALGRAHLSATLLLPIFLAAGCTDVYVRDAFCYKPGYVAC
eukprot:3199985-Pleurochrysis_carterae.AAC.1